MTDARILSFDEQDRAGRRAASRGSRDLASGAKRPPARRTPAEPEAEPAQPLPPVEDQEPSSGYAEPDEPFDDPAPTVDHLHDVRATATADAANVAGPPGITTALAAVSDFLRRRLSGDYPVDELGFDPELTDKVLMPPLRLLYGKWFRVEMRGLENVPTDGGALVVANHSGTIALDSLMTQVGLHDHHHRDLRMLGANLVFATPFLGELARKSGHTLACNPDAERLLLDGQIVGVWPEGFKGVGKRYRDRYKLQRFGRGGFVSAAIRTGAPIIPCSIMGAEEIYPMIGNAGFLARLLGLPYFPLTPTFPWLGPLGLIPLPSKWVIEFGEPIHTDDLDHSAAEDPMLVFNITDQVRETIQQTLYRLLVQRRGIFT